jgi:hypothetical protein
MTMMEHWDEANLKEQEAQANAAEARDAYKDALREINYGTRSGGPVYASRWVELGRCAP